MENIIAFIIWALVGCFFVGMGIFSFFSRKTVGFWANIKMDEVSDKKKYNQAMGKLWILYGLIFIVLGIPLVVGQNSPLIVISILGVLLESIAVMIAYTLIISSKYKK